MFGEVVLDVEAGAFEAELDLVREELGVDDDSSLSGDDMKMVVARFKDIYKVSILMCVSSLSLACARFLSLSLSLYVLGAGGGAVWGGCVVAKSVLRQDLFVC
jgi:hypothetical protein